MAATKGIFTTEPQRHREKQNQRQDPSARRWRRPRSGRLALWGVSCLFCKFPRACFADQNVRHHSSLQSKGVRTCRRNNYFPAHSRKRTNKGFRPVHCLWKHLRIPMPTPPWRQPTAPWPPPPPCSRVLPLILTFSVSPCLRGEYPFGCCFTSLRPLCVKSKPLQHDKDDIVLVQGEVLH